MNVNKSFLIGVDICDNEDLSTLVVAERVVKNKTMTTTVTRTFYGADANKLYEILVSGIVTGKVENNEVKG